VVVSGFGYNPGMSKIPKIFYVIVTVCLAFAICACVSAPVMANREAWLMVKRILNNEAVFNVSFNARDGRMRISVDQTADGAYISFFERTLPQVGWVYRCEILFFTKNYTKLPDEKITMQVFYLENGPKPINRLALIAPSKDQAFWLNKLEGVKIDKTGTAIRIFFTKEFTNAFDKSGEYKIFIPAGSEFVIPIPLPAFDESIDIPG
jgi:hypothetical protein